MYKDKPRLHYLLQSKMLFLFINLRLDMQTYTLQIQYIQQTNKQSTPDMPNHLQTAEKETY